MVRIHIPLFMTDLTDRLLEIVMGRIKQEGGSAAARIICQGQRTANDKFI